MKSWIKYFIRLSRYLVLLGAYSMLCVAGFVAAETRLELEESKITGARELPKVLYIVPWRKSPHGLRPLPIRSLVEEPLEPIEMDRFRRQQRYYGMIHGDSSEAE